MDLIGKYQHERSENLDGYFKAVGVPYLVRLMITRSNPDLEISKDDDKWTISSKSLIRTSEKTFELGAEYDDVMPKGILKCVTTLENGKLITISVLEDGNNKTKTIYEINEGYLIMTIIHEMSGQEAKRFFKKVLQ